MHLLLVEDDPRLGDLVARLLGGERHLVERAASGNAALEMAEAPGLDAIVLDVGLPDISGLEVARRLRARGSVVPILMLTARDAVADWVAGLDSGADDYLTKPFAIEELSARVREALEAVAADAGVRLVLDLEPAPVHGDEARLRQLAGILVDNAIKHSPSGGRVTVTVRLGARLTVEDEGPGIDPAHLDKAFDRFWRAPGAPAGGTGLGLAIARWIAERHGGTIQAGNRVPGPGASFVVRVPED